MPREKTRRDPYNTNLAAEFYVLSALHRLGAEATLTLGNKKAVERLRAMLVAAALVAVAPCGACPLFAQTTVPPETVLAVIAGSLDATREAAGFFSASSFSMRERNSLSWFE